MDLIQTIYDSRGFKTMVFDNAMPESIANKWLDQRRSVKFYKTKQNKIPMSFRVHAVNAKERESLFSLSGWLEPYLKEYHPDLSESDSFSRSFINCYQKNEPTCKNVFLISQVSAIEYVFPHLCIRLCIRQRICRMQGQMQGL